MSRALYERDVARRILAPGQGAAKPSARWQVYDRYGCAVIVSLFDRYPLRAKKARDYAIWREAVIEWNVTGARKGKACALNWGRMVELKAQLEAVRGYAGPLRRAA